MKVFLSWSGDRSHDVAQALGNWLAQVVQAVEPWISSRMDKGTRWPGEIASRLEEAKVGIICLTRESLNAPWLLFEAGALSKTKDAYVCTFLLNLGPEDVDWPLAQFQHTVIEEDDVRQLVHTINNAVGHEGERALSDGVLNETFEVFWPRLETRLAEIAAEHEEEAQPVRSEREMLTELLSLVRSQERRLQQDQVLRRMLLQAERTPQKWHGNRTFTSLGTKYAQYLRDAAAHQPELPGLLQHIAQLAEEDERERAKRENEFPEGEVEGDGE